MKKIIFILIVYPSLLYAQKYDFTEIAQRNSLFNVQAINFYNIDTILAIASDTVAYENFYISYDSGENWKMIGSASEFTNDFRFGNSPNEVYSFEIEDFEHSKLIYSNDTGLTANELVLSGRENGFHKFQGRLFCLMRIYNGSNSRNSLQLTKNYWQNFTELTSIFSAFKLEYKLDSTLIFQGYVSKSDTLYWLSNDFGKTWTGLCKIPEDSRGFSRPFTYISIDTAYYYDVNYTDNSFTIYWSFDGGKNIYTQYTTNYGSPENGGNVKMATSKIGYRLSGDKLYKTYDGGQTWYYKYTFECPVTIIETIDQNHVYFHHMGGSQSVNKCIYITHNGAEPLVETQVEPQKNDFKLYPNPATNSITLQTPNGQNAHLSIINLMGQVQYQNTAQAPGNIDISHLATGLYIFELKQGAQIFRQRIEVVK